MLQFIPASWPAPERVVALTTCRQGGVSEAGFAGLNLATHVHDTAWRVAQNRSILEQTLQLPAAPVWLEQVHGSHILELAAGQANGVQADAVMTRQQGRVCAVMTADCLPVLLCNEEGRAVAAVHAGWRGLLAGIVEKTAAKLGAPQTLLAWLGPAIGPGCFEVGAEVRDAFIQKNSVMQQAFRQVDDTHYLADLYALARMTLLQNGVKRIYGGEHCTYNDSDNFYSYRREPVTGRMASLIWLQP